MRSRSRGFTLFELIVVLALAAVILGVGVPSFRDFQRNNRLTVAANDVLGMVITSRSEALRRQITISMCTSADPEDEDATCGDGSGWIVFEDPDANCVRDAGEEWISGARVDYRRQCLCEYRLHLLRDHWLQAGRGRAADHVAHDVLR